MSLDPISDILSYNFTIIYLLYKLKLLYHMLLLVWSFPDKLNLNHMMWKQNKDIDMQ